MLKKCDVKIGGMYIAKVTNRLVQIRIDSESRFGGWNATNVVTQKPIRIKSVQRLRSVADVGVAECGKKAGKGKKTSTNEAGTQPAQTSLATAEVTANPQPATVVCPNCGGTTIDEEGDCAKCLEPKIAEQGPKAKRMRTAKAPKEKRMSGLDAAAKVLEEAGIPMNVKEITDVALTKGYWKARRGARRRQPWPARSVVKLRRKVTIPVFARPSAAALSTPNAPGVFFPPTPGQNLGFLTATSGRSGFHSHSAPRPVPLLPAEKTSHKVQTLFGFATPVIRLMFWRKRANVSTVARQREPIHPGDQDHERTRPFLWRRNRNNRAR